MTRQLGEIWNEVNKILTYINAFLAGILFSSPFNPESKQARKIPLAANIALLAFMVAIFVIFFLYITRQTGPAFS